MIAVGFALLSALLLWAVIGARGHWLPKLVLVVAVPSFSFAVWHSLEGYKGWPSGQGPPEHAQFLWGAVDEPDPATGSPGEIDLWLVPPDPQRSAIGYDSRTGEPRVYRLPYSRELHRQVLAAEQAVKHGVPVGYSRRGRGQRGSNTNRHRARMHFYRLPPPVAQRKERP